jgi:hypothetical protein
LHAIQSAGSLETQLVGDVWSVHLPFVEDYICLDSEVKIVVVKRSREMVVNSFMAKTIDKKANHWQWHGGEGKKPYFLPPIPPVDSKSASSCILLPTAPFRNDSGWDLCFPKYPNTFSKAEAIGQYWDLYENYTDYLEAQYPDNVRVFKTEDVFGQSSQDVQAGMLSWIGIATNEQVYDTAIHENHIELNPSILSYLSFYLFIYLSIHIFIHLSIYLSTFIPSKLCVGGGEGVEDTARRTLPLHLLPPMAEEVEVEGVLGRVGSPRARLGTRLGYCCLGVLVSWCLYVLASIRLRVEMSLFNYVT